MTETKDVWNDIVWSSNSDKAYLKQTVERRLTIADLSGKGFQCVLCSHNSKNWEEMERHFTTIHKDVRETFIKSE